MDSWYQMTRRIRLTMATRMFSKEWTVFSPRWVINIYVTIEVMVFV